MGMCRIRSMPGTNVSRPRSCSQSNALVVSGSLNRSTISLLYASSSCSRSWSGLSSGVTLASTSSSSRSDSSPGSVTRTALASCVRGGSGILSRNMAGLGD